MTDVSAHYDERYFAGQSADALFSGAAEVRKFEPFIRPTDTVVDLGCGGGFLLARLDCAKRIGVDVNPAALQNCQQLGLSVVDDLARIDDNCADVVISNHAIEHMTDPYEKLLQVRRTLKSNGMAVFVVPCERYDFAFRPDDADRHLYTWSPMNLGNLFQSAGFQVIECRKYLHRWPPGRHAIVKLVGWTAFHVIARVYGFLSRRHSQVRIIARKS